MNATEVSLPGGSSGLALIDPVAEQIVGSHYALSHYCAGLMILARRLGEDRYMRQADSCLKYIEATHAEYAKKNDYHYDFNNFAWALLLLINSKETGFLSDQVKSRLYNLLMNTPDSGHATVNWLPMRALNNFVRHLHTGEKRYHKMAKMLLEKVAAAQNRDGMYDDLLPVGKSANIQYHVYTTAVLKLIRHFKLDNGGGSLENALAFTAGMIDPEGDFNYFGRGANQIFGWGPFFFNLEGLDVPRSIYDSSIDFFSKNLSDCLNNNGLLLSNSQPDQNNYWWDYHYTTVYAAHLFLWLNLVCTIVPERYYLKKVSNTSNLELISAETVYCAVFKGKSHYLCERGPQICNLWIKSRGSLFKGPLGPFFDDFGNKHISKAMVLMNYFGPVIEYPANFMRNNVSGPVLKVLQKMKLYNKTDADYGMFLKPVFPEELKTGMPEADTIEIEYRLRPPKHPVGINIPLFPGACLNGTDEFIDSEVNGKNVKLFHLGSACGTYGKFEIFRSAPQPNVRNIKLRFSLK